MVSQLQMASTLDLYYICQTVDRVARKPSEYLQNIEDIFGHMSSTGLVRIYPKRTFFHIFVEDLISSETFEDADKSDNSPGNYRVDALLKSNSIKTSGDWRSELGWDDDYEYRGNV